MKSYNGISFHVKEELGKDIIIEVRGISKKVEVLRLGVKNTAVQRLRKLTGKPPKEVSTIAQDSRTRLRKQDVYMLTCSPLE